MARGLLGGSILVYEMNLAPLTSEHGYPVRATGLYEMMNPKVDNEEEDRARGLMFTKVIGLEMDGLT